MKAAQAWGVAPSVFAGVNAPTAKWSDEDRASALAFMESEAAKCGGCGHDQVETMDAGNEFAYTAKALRCHACAAQARTGRALSESGNDTAGLFFAVTKDER